MGWIDPVESYASPPRLSDPEPRHVWAGALENAGDTRWDLVDTSVGACVFELDGCEDFDIENSTVDGVTFVSQTMPRFSVSRSAVVGCDLSGARFVSLRNARLADCKLVGADFGGAHLLDVAFERCVLRMVNLRGVELRRVQFIDCTLHDVDAYDLDAEDVGFAASDLERVNIDRLRARRVDLRGTRQLGIEHVGALNGCLVTDDQLSALSYQLAFAAGLSIERATHPDTSQLHEGAHRRR
jgi:fluoroquinolone resistance protein